MQAILTPSRLFDGDTLYENHALVIEDGRVSALVPATDVDMTGATDYPDCLAVPGFVDLQVNGGGGVLFNAAPEVATLEAMARAHRAYGTTGFLPTLISDTPQVMRRAIKAVAAAIEQGVPGILGIHLEGPCLSPGRHGAHDAADFVALDDEMLSLLTSLPTGKTLVTVAPEVAGNDGIARLVEGGAVVSGGHSEADYETTRAAFAAGMTGVTHLFNAMPPLLSRAPGMVGAALADEGSWFGIIADGHHVHPATLAAAVRAKQAGGALLVTDAMPTVGTPDASFELNGKRITAVHGRLTTADGTLAGAHLDMLSAVNNAARFAGLDWFEALRMASLYPARAIGLDGEIGALRPGMRASLLILDAQRRPLEAWVDGEPYGITSD